MSILTARDNLISADEYLSWAINTGELSDEHREIISQAKVRLEVVLQAISPPLGSLEDDAEDNQ